MLRSMQGGAFFFEGGAKMLQTLQIENVAVIEKSEIEFGPGMNVMTGETGAGKSIVIDSINAVLGGRTTRDIVRTRTDYARVTAVFSMDKQSEKWCGENDIDCQDGELILMRRITADGKNTCRINGMPVPVAQLKELGALLLDIHGQNDGQKLLNEKFHMEYLDSFGGLEDAIREYNLKYADYCRLKKEQGSISMDESEKERRIDLLSHQIEEIERAEIKPGEEEQLRSRRELLKNAGKLTEAINSAFTALYGGERTDGATSLLFEASREMETAAQFSDEAMEIASKLSDLRYAAEDVSEQLRDFKNTLDFSPEEFEYIEGRLELIKRLSRKYGQSEEEILEYLEKCRRELENIEFSEERLKKISEELEKCRASMLTAAEELSKRRKAAAKLLEKRIKEELSQLSMAGIRFEVAFEKTEPTSTGTDDVKFYMSANAGEAVGRISKIASGGELARIMLAMKNVLAENDPVGTMVFDEVDTGVSGVAAQRVGEKLASLGNKRQVICVTHLPQIAAMADIHFEIKKQQTNDKTYTYVKRLDENGRKYELARLIGGENITDITLASAAEQLTNAKEYKNNLNRNREN